MVGIHAVSALVFAVESARSNLQHTLACRVCCETCRASSRAKIWVSTTSVDISANIRASSSVRNKRIQKLDPSDQRYEWRRQ